MAVDRSCRDVRGEKEEDAAVVAALMREADNVASVKKTRNRWFLCLVVVILICTCL
jgi:hypothetical protein